MQSVASLRKKGITCLVAKDNVVKKAIEGTEQEGLAPLLKKE